MSAEILCPHCGRPMPIGGGSWRPEDEATVEQAAAEQAEVSSLSLLGSGSNDDTFAASPFGPRPGAAAPDPILGQFADTSPGTGPAGAEPGTPATRDLFPSIDFSGPSAPRAVRREESVSDDGEDEEPPRPSASWPIVLLGSYASALTLALAWSYLNPRARDRGPLEGAIAEDNRVDPGRQASLSRMVEPPGPIPAGRVVAKGESLKVGSLEVTPIEIRRQDVSLQKTTYEGKVQRRDGGKGAFVLSLRLRNTSADSVFAPLDQAFVRERGRGVVDTFIEAADGGRIYPYPLAVESEWSIAGQDFGELRPGESRVVAIASTPDAPGDDRGPFTWRIRLRTGVERTDVIGVAWPSAPPK